MSLIYLLLHYIVLLVHYSALKSVVFAFELSYRSDGPNFEYKSLQRLETTPFVMHDGSVYRDMLTIEASRAVGQFAQQHFHTISPSSQSHRRGGFHHHIHHHERPQTPQFYSPYEPFAPPRGPHHTAHVPPTPYTDALDFRDSRFVNIPKDLRDQRLLADRDEHLIIAQANEEEKGDHLTHGPNSLLGFGPPQVAPHTPHVTPQHASSFPSFEAAIQEHFGRFGPKRPSPHQPVHPYQEPLLYSPVPIPPNRGFRPPSSGGIIHNKSPFAGAHHHHHQVPPPAPYTSTPIQFPSIRHSTKSSKAIRFPSKKRRHDFFNTPRKVPIANYFNEF